MDFRTLIDRYSNEYTLIKDEGGQIVNGKYEEGTPTEYLVDLAIFPLEAEEAQMYEADKYSTEDIVIYTHVTPEAYDVNSEQYISITIENDDIVSFKGSHYKLDQIKNYDIHGKFLRCIAKKVVVE